MRTFESEPMQIPISRWQTRATGRKPSPRFASVVGQTQMRAPASRSRSSSWPSACVACTTVVRGPRQPVAREQLDRPQAVLGEALVDLARLLVGVHVQRQVVLGGVAAELARARRPGRRARSGGRHRRGSRRLAAPRARAGSRRPTPAGSAGCRRAGSTRRGRRTRRPPPAAASAAARASSRPR